MSEQTGRISINEILRSAVAAAVAAGYDAKTVATAASAEAERAAEDADNKFENRRLATRALEYAQRAEETLHSLKAEVEDVIGEQEARYEMLDLADEAGGAVEELYAAVRRFQTKLSDA